MKITASCAAALLILLPCVLASAETVTVTRFVVNAGTPAQPFPVNTYLVADPQTRCAVVIDPGAADPRIAAAVAERGLRVTLILNTHGHADHSAGNRELREQLRAAVAAPAADRPLYGGEAAAAVDTWVHDGQVLRGDGVAVQVLATPGHTPGSVCYLIAGQLFSGDTLLAGGGGRVPGRGRAASEALRRLVQTIRRRLLVLPADTPLWPGHDRPSSVGEESLLNPFLR